MENKLLLFFKKTYVIFIVIAAAIIFFLGYNTYLVDHSLLNLKLALDKVSDARTIEDVKKIQQMLEYPLKQELAKKKINIEDMAELEYAKDILANPQNMGQVEDAKFFLKKIIAKKEQQRGAVMSSLDAISKAVLPIEHKESISALKKEERALKEKIANTRDSGQLQDFYSQLNIVYYKLSEFKKAEEATAKIVELDPKSYKAAKVKFTEGWNYKQRGSFEAVRKIFNQVINEYPDTEMAVLSKYQLADILYKEGRVKESIAANEEFSTLYPGLTVAQLAQFKAGAVYLYDLKDYDSAIKAFDQVAEKWNLAPLTNYIDKKIVPYVAKRYRSRGYYLLSKKRYAAAIDIFDRAIEINKRDAQCYTGKALAFLGKDENEKALELARQAVKIDPRDWLSVANLGYVYLRLGMYEMGIEQYRKAAILNAKVAEIYYNLGCGYARLSNFMVAAAQFKKAISLRPDFAYAYNNLGFCLWYEGNFGQALEALSKAGQIRPDYLDAQYNLGLVYENQALYDKAKEAFKNALKQDPGYLKAKEKLQKLESRVAG